MSVPARPPTDLTLLLSAAADGDVAAANQLLPLVYEQLRKAAQLSLAGERPGHTLTATALVHEAYLKLVGTRAVSWAGPPKIRMKSCRSTRRCVAWRPNRPRQRG